MSSSSNGIFSPCKSVVEDEVVGSDPPGSFQKGKRKNNLIKFLCGMFSTNRDDILSRRKCIWKDCLVHESGMNSTGVT